MNYESIKWNKFGRKGKAFFSILKTIKTQDFTAI
ncbi:hypothetical protein SAMN05444146_0309 [Flavobacterium johnsoniae]|nr:hypothetical protein SAMN05444146_0309 [Flavobacterium johnsoniae]